MKKAYWIAIRIGGILAALGLLAALLTGALDGFIGVAYVMFGVLAACALLAFAIVSFSSFGASVFVIGLNGFVVLATVLIVAGQLGFDRNVRDVVVKTDAAISDVETAAYDLSFAWSAPTPISDTDLASIVPILNQLRELPFGRAQTIKAARGGPNALPNLGLVDGAELTRASDRVYRRALSQQFLPRLLLRLEEQMQANLSQPDFLYDALKVYLMLGQQGPMNRDLVKEWMTLDWSISYPGRERDRLRDDLDGHIDALISAPMDQIGLNGPLIDQVQSLIADMPLAQRVYQGIVTSPRAQSLPDLRLTDIGGPALSRVFVRASGAPLNEGVDGIFTYDGFYDVFLAEIIQVSRRVQNETWVLGRLGETVQSDEMLATLSRDVLDLYYTDYIAAYTQLLSDIDIVPMRNLRDAVEVTNVLSGPTSPLVNILNALADETRLTEDRSISEADRRAGDDIDVNVLDLQSALSTRGQQLAGTLRQSVDASDAGRPAQPGAFVEERFQWLQDITARASDQNSTLDALMARLTEVYQELNRVSLQGTEVESPTELLPVVQFVDFANRMPDPIPRWASQISSVSLSNAADATRASINARWQSDVLPFCQQALNDRFPFARRARADVAMQDFARLFAPGGMMDTFFDENLREFVDTRARPWAWKPVNGSDLGIGPAVLQQIQYAAEIRDAFFANGDSVPSIDFQLTPEALDPNAEQVALTVHGQVLRFQQGRQPEPVAINWPGSVGEARITFQPEINTRENSLSETGNWAWFRLLSAAEVRRTNVSDRSRVIFNVGGRIAIFQLQSSTVLNPFNLPALSSFTCPQSF